MKVAIIEPFYGGSHKNWVDGLISNLDLDFELFTLPDRHWKWRMHGAAITLADQYLASGLSFDLIIASDMLDLTTFLALTRNKSANTPVILYFHENQLTYPWSPDDPDIVKNRENHYAFINYASALAATRVLFNSDYHLRSFIGEIHAFLNAFPDHRNLKSIRQLEQKCSVLHVALNLSEFDRYRHTEKESQPLILWNHRWEYDKNPDLFFNTLFKLSDSGFGFKLVVLGQSYGRHPAIFAEARERLGRHIVQWGHVDSFSAYAYWLWKADILPVTSIQDFFGISVVEATYCQTLPLVPDRLAYPEYIPDTCVYDSEPALLEMIKGYDQISVPNVAKFDWKSMKASYMDRITELVAR